MSVQSAALSPRIELVEANVQLHPFRGNAVERKQSVVDLRVVTQGHTEQSWGSKSNSYYFHYSVLSTTVSYNDELELGSALTVIYISYSLSFQRDCPTTLWQVLHYAYRADPSKIRRAF